MGRLEGFGDSVGRFAQKIRCQSDSIALRYEDDDADEFFWCKAEKPLAEPDYATPEQTM